MNFPIIKISAYHAWVGKDGNPRPGCRPYDTDFYTEMDRIRDGHYKPIVDKCREIKDEEERKRYKVSYLPSLTISAVCRDWRKIENVISHTGLLNLDIDQKSNQHIDDWPGLRDQIFQLPGVIACFLSVSGMGVTFVVKVNPEQHKDTFFSIVDEMKQHMNISVDAGLHDITRLRFVSHDPGCKIRYNFDEIPPIQPSVQYLQSKKDFGNYSISLEPNGDADSEYNFNEAVKRAESRFAFQDGNKWSFLVSVAGSCNVMGMSLEFCRSMVMQRFRDKTTISDAQLIKPVDDVYKIYKSQHGTFDIQLAFENLNRKVKGVLIYDFLHQGLKPTEDDIKRICQENDANPERVYYVMDRVFGEYADEFGYKDFPMVKKVQIWLSKRWDFKFNQVTGQAEVSEKGMLIVDTVNPDEIYRQLELNRFKFNLNNVKSLMKSAFVKPYDPIMDYFRGTTYDSSRDYIAELGSHVKTAEGDFWDIMFKKALVRSIACGIGKKENRIVMVLYGKKQETGKSTFIRFLSPWEDGRYFTESPIIGGNQKDTEIRFSENFIYNMEELAGLSRADVNKLKADISKSHIKERRAYAYFEASMPRRANFWGSTNLKEFLHDEENTRWLIFDVQALDWAYKQHTDIHKVWGQAWQLYKDGFDYDLDLADKKIREFLNQDYRYKRPEEELILRHFRPATPTTGQFYSATEIAIELNNMSSSLKINPNNIGKTISAIFELESIQAKIEGRNQRGYWLQKIFNQAEGENRFPQIPANNTRELPF